MTLPEELENMRLSWMKGCQPWRYDNSIYLKSQIIYFYFANYDSVKSKLDIF